MAITRKRPRNRKRCKYYGTISKICFHQEGPLHCEKICKYFKDRNNIDEQIIDA